MVKLSKTELREREKVIQQGLHDFLDDNDLDLSDQNTELIKKHLNTLFTDNKSISATTINNFLSETFEYNEYNRTAFESAHNQELSEEALAAILISADKKKANPAKTWFILLTIFMVIIGLTIYLMPETEDTQISISQAEELRMLVSDIVETEKQNGNKTTHQSVWNTIKRNDEIYQLGYKPSYKDFSTQQYKIAKQELENWKVKAKHSAHHAGKGHVMILSASDITVTDGDTFKTKDGKFRLWGVDAFEKKQNCYDINKQPYSCGTKAKETLQQIFQNAAQTECTETTKDRYKRSIVKCEIGGTELGQILVQSGWAMDYTKYSGGHFKPIENQAKEMKAGAWSGCFIEPWDYRHKKNLDKCLLKTIK